MQKKKVLFVASVTTHFHAFHIPYFEWLKNHEVEVHATAFQEKEKSLDFCDKFINIEFKRSPFAIGNIKAYKKLKSLIEREKYDLIHCHTPMASVITRLAAKKMRKHGTKVIYTAHGFHFFNGGPKAGWMIYYPMEKWLSRFTDALITINKEDYKVALENNFKAQNIYLVPGVGVDRKRVIFSTPEIKLKLRKEYGYKENEFILIYAAEFIERKNHKLIINSLPTIVKHVPNIKIIFPGRGPLLKNMIQLSEKLNIKQYIDFVGFRKDIGNLVALSDIGISTSKQEGLPINIAEDMSSGLPIIATPCRGNNELVQNNINGFLIKNPQELENAILELYHNQEKRKKFGEASKVLVEKYSIENALDAHAEIYNKFLN